MKKIMLVEDDQTMRTLLKTLLELEGFAPVLIGEPVAEEIMWLMRQETPEAVLLDVHLHGTNGFDILRAIRIDNQLKLIKVLMSSGKDVQDECIAAGADGFLLKPYMPDDLINWFKNNI